MGQLIAKLHGSFHQNFEVWFSKLQTTEEETKTHQKILTLKGVFAVDCQQNQHLFLSLF